MEFAFDLLPGNKPPYEYAPGHVTITTHHGLGTSRPGYPFMLALSLTELLSALKPFLLHGKMSGFTWAVIDASFAVYFQRATRRLKGQQKPIRIVCGSTDLGAVFEQELVEAILDCVHRFLRSNAGKLGTDEADLIAVTRAFAATFGLEDHFSASSGSV